MRPVRAAAALRVAELAYVIPFADADVPITCAMRATNRFAMRARILAFAGALPNQPACAFAVVSAVQPAASGSEVHG